MPNEKQDLMNHRQTAQACKNYTDKEIKASEERILSIVARNNVNFIDHINEPTYRFTAPLNSKLLMLQSIAGNSNKIAPSTPSDDSVARLKVIPENTYKGQVDYIGGKTVKYNQLVQNGNFESVDGWTSWVYGNQYSVNNNECHIYGLTNNDISRACNVPANHKCLILYDIKGNEYSTNTYFGFSNSAGATTAKPMTTSYQTISAIITTQATPTRFYIYAQGNNANNEAWIRRVELIDLTDKFGAGNEPSTVETAIPLLKASGYKLDGTDTYSTGDLKHAIVSGVEYNSINKFNKNGTFIEAYCDGSGKLLSNSDMKSYVIEVSSSQTYYFYTNNKNGGMQRVSFTPNIPNIGDTIYSSLLSLGFDTYTNETTITVPNNMNYMIVTFFRTSTATNTLDEVINNLCINISNASYNGNYYPYVAPITKAIPSEVLADVRYGLGFDNTNYNHLDIDGHLRGNWNIVDLSTCEWTQVGATTSGYYVWRTTSITDIKYVANNTQVGNGVYSKGKIRMASGMTGNTDLYNLAIDTAQVSCVTTNGTTDKPTGYLVYELATAFDQDYSQYFTDGWNKVDLNKQYATCEMVVAEPIDMPNKVEYYGTIIHSLATAVKQEGFNVWDEVWESGLIGNNGEIIQNTLRRTTSFIPILPNTSYYVSTNVFDGRYAYYDINKNAVAVNTDGFTTNINVSPNNAYYLRVSVPASYGTTYNNDICINISNQDLNGTYKPHKATITRLLPNSEAKYSWGITDGVRNTRVFCDDEGNAVNEGSLVVGNQDLGGLNYTYDSDNVFIAQINSLGIKTSNPNCICSKYNYIGQTYQSNLVDKSFIIAIDGLSIRIKDTTYTNATTFKTDMSGEMLKYEKATTDTETLDDFDYFFDCEEGDTFTIIGCELLQCYATYSFLIKEARTNE